MRTLATKLLPHLLTLLFSFHLPVHAEPTQTSSSSPLRIGTMKNNPPWAYKKDGQWVGKAIERQRKLFLEINRTSEPVMYDTFPRIMHDLVSGKIDVAPGSSSALHSLPNHSSYICSNESLSESEFGAYTLASSTLPTFTDLNDLKPYRAAIVRIIDISMLTPYIPKEQILQHHNPMYLYRVLVGSRVDLVIAPNKTFKAWNETYGTEFKKVLSFGSFKIFLCFSKVSLGEKQALDLSHQVDNILIERKNKQDL
jgi:ABC-type amino acid transport substrate-binding protein